MAAADKLQCPVRLYKEDYDKIRALAAEDGLNYQKVAEYILLQYMKGNKEIATLVKRHAAERKAKNGSQFDETEKDDIFKKISEVSPIKHFDERR